MKKLQLLAIGTVLMASVPVANTAEDDLLNIGATIIPPITVLERGNTPCSRSKGRIASCTKEGKFLCRDGSISKSKKRCGGRSASGTKKSATKKVKTKKFTKKSRKSKSK